jgi:hypothetical protein
MRALCGAIIATGAMIGLGLTAIGFGTRYQNFARNFDENTKQPIVLLGQMDKPLMFILMFLTAMAVIGLAIAIVGLSYHHRRRHHELEHMLTHPETHHHANA